MSEFEIWEDKLAELAVFGANVQPGQLVAVTSYIGKERVTRKVARAAYRRGALFVDVLYFDQWIKRERIAHAQEDTLDYIPPWMAQRLLHLSDQHAARIGFAGPHAPRALEGCDPARVARDLLPSLPETGEVVNRMTTSWCLVPVPTRSWAEIVYSTLEREDAYERLWEAIAHVCRLEADDPAQAWAERNAALKGKATQLTERRFDALRFHGPGTDLAIGLLPSAHWAAGGLVTVDGRAHFPNIPTEELFTTPDPERVDGYVSSTLPLDLSGTLLTGIRVEFQGGRAVKVDAETGADALRAVVAKDEGAARLGEVALVDGDGRVGPLETVFYDTLVDENAASHIALGSGYDHAVDDPADKARINDSSIHLDFMIGSAQIAVDGITHEGAAVPVIRDNEWQL